MGSVPHSYCCLDIETTGLESPEITCIATLVVNPKKNQTHSRVWYKKLGEVMDNAGISILVDYIYSLHIGGIPIVTFNGAGFDLKVIHDCLAPEETVRQNYCKQIALEHHDVMLKFTCENGFFSSLQSFLDASDCKISKTGKGEDAISAWMGPTATKTTQEGVLDYCKNDVLCLSHVYSQLWKPGPTKRKTKSGRIQEWNHDHELTVQICLEKYMANPPENSWMRNPPDVMFITEWAR